MGDVGTLCHNTMPSPMGNHFPTVCRMSPIGGDMMAQRGDNNSTKETGMRHLPIIAGIAISLVLMGCGEDSKAAAKEAAKSTGKLVGAVVTDAAKTTMEVATEVASGAGEVIKENGEKAIDSAAKKAKDVAKDTRDAIAKKAKATADSAKKAVQAK